MTDAPVEIDWSTTHVSDGSVQVKFSAAPDHAWRYCAAEIARTWESETRAQTWRTLSVREAGIYVSGLESDDASGLQEYLTALVAAANTQAVDERQRRAKINEERERAEEKTRARDARLTDQFRTPPQ